MKYSIITINDDRLEYKNKIREVVDGEEIFIPATNGALVDLDEELDKRGMKYFDGTLLTKGELGVWISTFDNWLWAAENGPLLVFEDDAIPTPRFNGLFKHFLSELPDDWDFLALWVPENQYPDYHYDVEYDSTGNWEMVGPHKNGFTSNYNFGAMRLAKVYQGYGNVATLYSQAGAQKLIDQTRKEINNPVDCFIFVEAHVGRANGFAPKPHWAKAVTYDWASETTIHNTERYR